MYSNDLKWRIIYLQNDGYSKRKISEILYISISLINKVLCLHKKWGTVANPWRKKYQDDTPKIIEQFRIDMDINTSHLFIRRKCYQHFPYMV